MTGYYLMHRDWQHSAVFARDEFSRRDAWVWLIEAAAFQPTEIFVSGRKLAIGRGQLCHSLRFMARAWGWDDAKVRRFLSRIESENMIACVVDAGQTVITICKYDDYQVPPRVADAPTDAAVTQQRRSDDAKKNEGKEGKEESLSDESVPARRALAEMFVEIWKDELGDALEIPRKLTPDRIRLVALRFVDTFGRNPEQWRSHCQQIRGSPFCLGQKGWRADFDWALRPKSILRLQEGKYRDHANGHAQTPAAKLFEGAFLALQDRAARATEPERSAHCGAGLDPAEPLLDGGRSGGGEARANRRLA